MTSVVPAFEELKKEGESGRRKLTQYTRYGSVALATFQAVGASIALQNQGVNAIQGPLFVVLAATSLVAGTMFLVWLGEQVTERGIGNGISMIIFAGIVAGLPSAVGGTLQLVRNGEMNPLFAVVILALAFAVIAGVVFVERGQRRIPVHYAKRQQGRRLFAAQTTHLPLKLNMAGVIPPIFASSLILFPVTLGGWLGGALGDTWGASVMQRITAAISPGQPVYILLYAALIIFFCFFYTALVFNARETADNLKRSGAFIPGIRPGQNTANYIDGVLTRLTVVGAIYITAVCLMPEFLILSFNVPFHFGGTSLLIIVVVVMDFMAQVQAHLMSHQYEGLLKKSNLKAAGRVG
jgi:preprotein translocase subunit SecY